MAVLVSSSISKSGWTISGNSPHIVIVQTNPGYDAFRDRFKHVEFTDPGDDWGFGVWGGIGVLEL